VLLAPYHNGTITMHYRQVAGYAVTLRDPRSPGRISSRRDWLADTIECLSDGTMKHVIEWEDQVWTIESREVDYQWMPSDPLLKSEL
jgi:hypothetical protein